MPKVPDPLGGLPRDFLPPPKVEEARAKEDTKAAAASVDGGETGFDEVPAGLSESKVGDIAKGFGTDTGRLGGDMDVVHKKMPEPSPATMAVDDIDVEEENTPVIPSQSKTPKMAMSRGVGGDVEKEAAEKLESLRKLGTPAAPENAFSFPGVANVGGPRSAVNAEKEKLIESEDTEDTEDTEESMQSPVRGALKSKSASPVTRVRGGKDTYESEEKASLAEVGASKFTIGGRSGGKHNGSSSSVQLAAGMAEAEDVGGEEEEEDIVVPAKTIKSTTSSNPKAFSEEDDSGEEPETEMEKKGVASKGVVKESGEMEDQSDEEPVSLVSDIKKKLKVTFGVAEDVGLPGAEEEDSESDSHATKIPRRFSGGRVGKKSGLTEPTSQPSEEEGEEDEVSLPKKSIPKTAVTKRGLGRVGEGGADESEEGSEEGSGEEGAVSRVPSAKTKTSMVGEKVAPFKA